MISRAEEQIIEEQLSERSGEEIACAYRAICAAMLVRTACLMRHRALRKMDINQKTTAHSWVTGGHGLIPFDQACRAVNAEPTEIVSRLQEMATSRP